jgi:coenzyme F420 biosynthesis associated uncharacterized protein
VTGLIDAADRAASVPVLVVNRSGFVRANAQMVDEMARGALDLEMSRADRVATSVEVGLALAFLSSRVLGQFDPFAARLMLVAPNVVRFERDLNVPQADFRLWVGLHEMTHAVQFAAAPWLSEHLSGLLRQLLSVESESAGLVDAARLIRAVARSVRGDAGANIVADVLSPPARVVMDRVTAVMSLLEGHADVVMDAVGSEVIPSLGTIRARFDARRQGRGAMDKLVRRVAGLDAKRSQYVEGAAFVRGVLDLAGHDGLAAAFASESNLPTFAEISDPAAWVARVLS